MRSDGLKEVIPSPDVSWSQRAEAGCESQTFGSVLFCSLIFQCTPLLAWRLPLAGTELHAFNMNQKSSRANSEQPSSPDRVQDSTNIWANVWQQASQRYDKQQDAGTIQAGEADEVNPWLRRTGWIEYLKGCQPKELLQSTSYRRLKGRIRSCL